MMLPNTILVRNFYSFVSRGTELAMLQKNQVSLFNKFMGNFSDLVGKITSSLESKGVTSTVFNIKSALGKKLEVGYASSGQVIASSSNRFRVGDLVACAGVGFATHSEYCVVPTNLAVLVKSEEKIQQASVTAIGAIALQALRRANLAIGEIVCVFGLGLLGLLTVQLAKLSGLIVIGLDVDPEKLTLAKSFGADEVFLCNQDDSWINQVLNFTQSLGVDAVIVTAASSDNKVIDQAVSICRKKGKIVVAGDVPCNFSREAFYLKELDFLMSCSYGPGRYDSLYESGNCDYPYSYVRWTEGRNLQFIADLISKNLLQIDTLVSGVFRLEQASEAYEVLQQGSLGIIFDYTSEQNFLDEKELISLEEKSCLDSQVMPSLVAKDFATKDILSVALVGAGGFAKTMLAPILTQIEGVMLDMVFDASAAKSLDFSETFGFQNIASKFEAVLVNPDVDVVVIATPAQFHCEQVMRALQFGKAVFCEKPMVKNWQEFYTLQTFLEKQQGAFFAVDFNRSFAPMILALQEECSQRVSPLMISYRVNAGISGDSSASFQRLVGEVCHFLELFLFLVQKDPVQMAATFSNSAAALFEENLSVTLSFEDGSIATLIYSSVAHTDLGKERCELFWDGKSAIVDDYKSVIGYGLSKSIDCYNLVADKGHANHLSTFFCAIKKNEPGVFSKNWHRYFLATWLSLKLEELLLQNGGMINIKNSQLLLEK